MCIVIVSLFFKDSINIVWWAMDVETEPFGSDEYVGTATSWSNGQPTQIKSGYNPYWLRFAQMCARAAGSLRDVGISLFLWFACIYDSCTRHFFGSLL